MTQLEKELDQCVKLLNMCYMKDNKSKKQSYRLFEAKLGTIIRDHFTKKFWSHFKENFEPDSNIHVPFMDAVEFLVDAIKILSRPSYGLLRDKFFNQLKIAIISGRPFQLKDYIDATYFKALKIFLFLRMDGEDDADFLDFDELDRDNCGLIYERFCKVNEQLRELNLSDHLVDETVVPVAQIFIEKKVSSKCKSNYSNSYLEMLTDWVREHIEKWIAQIYGSTDKVNREKLSGILKDVYAEVRVSHMFEIIIEYPNSEAAIYDLKMYLKQSTSSEFRINLINNVKQSLIESLLHPGVNTYDILTAYISAIKALRALDPTGLILESVAEPVRKYLKSRSDTVRCIVKALTDEEHSDLNREMIKAISQTNENGIEGRMGAGEVNVFGEEEFCLATNFEDWNPDPIKLMGTDGSSRHSDLLTSLIKIYETPDLFYQEYKNQMGDRLLNKYRDCDLDSEVKNLELLSKRFSDPQLQRCEVMLKDVQTSKRINRRILSGEISQHQLTRFKNLDVLIVSTPFWPDKFGPMPSISDETPELEFPPEINQAIETYTKAFEAIQASRTLQWRHHLGTVDMEVTIKNKKRNFTVSPLHASILYLFKRKTSWLLSELIQKTSLPAAILQSRLALWERNGIIIRREDCYNLSDFCD